MVLKPTNIGHMDWVVVAPSLRTVLVPQFKNPSYWPTKTRYVDKGICLCKLISFLEKGFLLVDPIDDSRKSMKMLHKMYIQSANKVLIQVQEFLVKSIPEISLPS